MENSNQKAKLTLIGIGAVLLLTVVGMAILVSALGSKSGDDSQSRLQADILEGVEQEIEADGPGERPDGPEAGREITGAGEAETGIREPEASDDIDLHRILSEMKGYWEAGNMEAVSDLAHLPRYLEASRLLSGTTKFYYMGDTDGEGQPHGKGLAIYTDSQYYYGDWQDGVRSGSGMWIKYYVYEEDGPRAEDIYLTHSYSGEWAGDLPNGEGAEHYDFVVEHLKQNEGYNRNFIGSFKNGLYDGEIYITNYYSDGNVKEWRGNAREGAWEPMGDKDKAGRYPVIVELKDDENYQWIYEKENRDAGVDGLISSAKKKD